MRSIRLNATELSVLSVLLDVRIAPLSTSRTTRAEALESLVQRRIVDEHVERVSAQVAALLAVLARPRHRVEIVSRNGAEPLVLALQTVGDVIHTCDTNADILTPSRDALAAVVTGTSDVTGHPFSLPGRTWHDMVAQARFANPEQLARMAQLDGCTAADAATAAQLAKHHYQRTDARVMSYRGKNRWRGSELSWIDTPQGTWLVDDGGRFGSDSDLHRRRAAFSPQRPEVALREALGSLN